MLRHVLLQVTRLRQSEQLSFEGGKPLLRHAGLCRRRQFLPGGTLRRSSSKKLKMKLTLLTALASPATESFSTAESFSTTKSLPSGCTSKCAVSAAFWFLAVGVFLLVSVAPQNGMESEG